MLEDDLAEVRKFSAVLRTPLNFVERHPWLNFATHLTGMAGRPHLTAVQGLAAIQLPAATFALIDVLDDPAFPYRVDAAVALTRNPHPSALEPFIRALNDPDPQLRRTAARALATVAALTVERDVEIAAVRDKLVEVLATDPEPAVRVAAFHGLTKFATMQILERAFDAAVQDSDRLVRCGMLMVAAHLAYNGRPGRRTGYTRSIVWNGIDPNSTPTGLGVLARARYRHPYFSEIDQYSDCIDVNEASLSVLARIQNPRVKPVLMRLTDSPDSGLRATVTLGLGEYKGDAPFDAIVAALDDPVAGVRKAAIEALGVSVHPRAGAALAKVLIHGTLHEQLAAAYALEDPTDDGTIHVSVIPIFGGAASRDPSLPPRFGPTESEALVEAFGASDARVRQAAERALRTKPQNVERSLIAALSSKTEHARTRAARLLAEYESAESMALLLNTLESGRAPESEFAALALGLRGDASAREALLRAATSKRSALATAAADALSDLGTPF